MVMGSSNPEAVHNESEIQFKKLFEQAPVGICLVDLQGCILAANENFCNILRNPLSDIVQKKISDLLVPEEGQEEIVHLKRVIDGIEEARNLKTALKRSQDEIYTAEITAYVVTDHNQKPFHRVYILKDTTELGRLQEQLIQADKLSALGQLVSGVSHELNNPLSSIIQYIELLQTFSPQDQLVQDCLDRMSKEAERTRRIVNNLLSFARTHETGHVEVDINELLDATLELRAYSLRVDNISVLRELGDIPKVVADRHQLQQVFLNIIINAEQAMKTKRPGGSLTVKTEHIKNGGPEYILVQITDNGPGIDPHNIEKVFEPFFTTKPVGQGTGLGLSISHKIVTDHGGSIRIESSLGRGVSFIIQLPLVSQGAAEASVGVINQAGQS